MSSDFNCIVGKTIIGVARKIEPKDSTPILKENSEVYFVQRKGRGGKVSSCTIDKETDFQPKTYVKNELDRRHKALTVEHQQGAEIRGNKLYLECGSRGTNIVHPGSASHQINTSSFHGDHAFAFIMVPYSSTGCFSLTDTIDLKDLRD